MNWQSFTYRIRRKYQQIKRVIDFLPLIWKGYDFDYQYSIDLFKKQLERTANYLESNSSYGMGATNRASRIRTAIRLIDKVYEERYVDEFLDSKSKDKEEFKRVIEKQKRAHKLLWDFVEHNIQYWWD